MARPRSEDKRNAILAAATRVFVTQGLGAPTAMIAQEAGVSNGSLFTYFGTKSDIFNALFLELKASMASAVFEGLPTGTDMRNQISHMWSNWMCWASINPEKRRVLALLSVSDEITHANRAAAHETMSSVADLLERCRANGPVREVPMGFLVAIMNSLAEATIDFMIHDPSNAEKHCEVGFEALWRVLT
jgi:AcrR family transcriptional regulator